MLDYQNLPQVPGRDVQMFTLPSTVTNLQWSVWTKPRGLSMAHIIAISGGSGGGSGWGAAVGGAGGGGGGGCSSGTSRVTIPLEFLPDRLFIQVGAGGAGSANGTGGSGLLSYVAIYPDTTATNVLCISGAAGPTGGTSGTSAAAGARGGVGSVAVIGSMPLAGLGIFNLIAGAFGSTGGVQTGAVGAPVAIANTSCLSGGGSGGAGKTSADFAGGLVTVIAGAYLSEYAPAAAPGATGLNHGSGGPQLWKPFFAFGGMGGGATNAGGGVGGTGGNGAYGAGGGGGGAGLTGGRGGDGGQGIVIISCF